MPYKQLNSSDPNNRYFKSALKFFRDTDTVLPVSRVKKGKCEIDFEMVDQFLKGKEGNIYGLFTRNRYGKKWDLRYIGQRKSAYIRERLRMHLLKNNPNAGSKINQTKRELRKGKHIGIKLFHVTPDSLRHYYEERLIQELEQSLDWNIHR